MKRIIIFSLLVFLVSCEKEAIKIRILQANVDGENITLIGHAQRYEHTKYGAPFGIDYFIHNYETPNLYILTLTDSTFSKSQFYFPDDGVAKYACTDSNDVAKSYNAIDGYLHILKEEDRILFGDFNFTVVNIHDSIDTLRIEDGHFEISLDEDHITWDN